LLIRDDLGNQKYNTDKILEIFIEGCKKIFSYSYYDIVSSGFGIFTPVYSTKNIDDLLTQYFSDLKLVNLRKPSCIISYDIAHSKSFYFNTFDHSDILVKDCILSSTSAPTYFYPYKLKIGHIEHQFIDGGIVTNNPAEICFLRACDYYDKNSSFYTLSLGTGYMQSNQVSSGTYGIYGWSKNILNTIFSANAEFQSNELFLVNKILEKDINTHNKFHRMNILLKDNINLDDVTSFDLMRKIMDDWIDKHSNELNLLCEKLLYNINNKHTFVVNN
jgi:patatin-like phospholipase/acyl hydrolase